MIPVKLRDKYGLVIGKEYNFEVRQFDDHNYICIDCGPNSDLEEAMRIVRKAGLRIIQNDD